MSNVETLQQAGLIPDASKLTPGETALINAMTAAEVSTLISVKQQLTDDFLMRNASVIRSGNCFI